MADGISDATAKQKNVYVFATLLVKFLLVLKPKFQASCLHSLQPHMTNCVLPDGKPILSSRFYTFENIILTFV